MGARKIRLETILDDGSKLVLSIDGPLDREKIRKYLDLLELMGASETPSYLNRTMLHDCSILDRLMYIIENRLSGKWFSVKEAQFEYEEEFGEPIKKSTLATYLNRLVDKKWILRAGRRGSFRYNLNVFKQRLKTKSI